MPNVDDQIKELKSRGAVEVRDGEGSGFAEDILEQELPADLAQEIQEMENRQHDIKPANQHLEAAAQMREANLEAARKFKFQRQEEVTDYVPGRIMHSDQLLSLLRTINRTFFYNDWSALGRRGLNYVRNGIAVPLTSVHDGLAIEWDQLRVDEHSIGTNLKYKGWRSVLMTLISEGVLTEDEVHGVFGKPIGPRAKRWFRNLYMLRNGICRECGHETCVCAELGEGARADNYARD
jgi:hypothetical protein